MTFQSKLARIEWVIDAAIAKVREEKMAENARARLQGKMGHTTAYIVEAFGDIANAYYPHENRLAKFFERPRSYATLGGALEAIDEWVRALGGPDPEDDRLLIWEVLPSGHKKVVWHFSGWHHNGEEFWELPQGALPGHSQCLYGEMMEHDYADETVHVDD